MTTNGESAVLVLAAGAGTRMRSDIPKVLHTLGGRSMLAHSLHAIAKMAPQHLVVVLGRDHRRIEQSDLRPRDSGRRRRVAGIGARARPQ